LIRREHIFAHNKFAHCEQFFSLSNFFADVSSKIIALTDPVLSQPDMEWEMISPPAGAYIPSFTIYHLLPDLPATASLPVEIFASAPASS
jgi:hypothetical protein